MDDDQPTKGPEGDAPKEEEPKLEQVALQHSDYKRTKPGEDAPVRYPRPDHRKREMYGVADQLMGASKLVVMCEDGRSRMGRIPGKMKRRMWIKPGDLLIIKPWDFQDDKADVKYRYTRTQTANMSRARVIPEILASGF